jgi:hypothetical protein
MRLIVTTETLRQLSLPPSEREPVTEAARQATLTAARELRKRLVIAPSASPVAHD